MRHEALVHVRTVVFRGAIRSVPVHQASNRSPSHSSTGAPPAATPGRRAVRGGARRRQSGRGSQRSRRPRGASRGRRRPIVRGGRSSLGAHGPRPRLGGRRRDPGVAVPTDRRLTPGTTLCPRCCPEPVTFLEALRRSDQCRTRAITPIRANCATVAATRAGAVGRATKTEAIRAARPHTVRKTRPPKPQGGGSWGAAARGSGLWVSPSSDETGRLDGAEHTGADHAGVGRGIPPVDAATAPRLRSAMAACERRRPRTRSPGVFRLAARGQ